MTALTAGKVRGLTETSTDAGVFTILAADHRDSMRAVLNPTEPAAVPPSVMTATKLALLDGLADLASAVLLDPEYSALQAVSQRSLPGDTGLLCALEAQGYLGDPNARMTTLLEGWGVEKAKRLGASAVKLLLLYRPDSGIAERQDETVAALVADCARYDLPLFLEPVSYGLEADAAPGTADFDTERRTVVCESARRLGAIGPDVLKVQFPADTSVEPDAAAWADACAELNEASPVPWALLSGGDGFDSFTTQVRMACEAGASGFLIGRALWGDFVTAPKTDRPGLLQTIVRPRLESLIEIATESGVDWARRHDLPQFDSHGYTEF